MIRVDNCVNNCVDINIDSKSVMSGGNTSSHGNQILFKGIEQSCVHCKGGSASDLKFCHQHILWWQNFASTGGRNVPSTVCATSQKCLHDKNDG